jgi:hypothetical protein
MGRQTGCSYKGVIKVLVKSTLNKQGNGLPARETVLLRVEEQSDKPGWWVETGESYVFLLDPLTEGEVKSLFAFAARAPIKALSSSACCFERANAARDSSGKLIWLDSPSIYGLRAARSFHADTRSDLCVE